MFASIDFNDSGIRSGHLLLALLANNDLVRFTHASSAEWRKITAEDLHNNFLTLVEYSEEDKDEFVASEATRPKVEDLRAPVTTRIFISYRRDESAGWARSSSMIGWANTLAKTVFLWTLTQSNQALSLSRLSKTVWRPATH